MGAPIDAATTSFLEAAADDLQRQAGRAGVIERMTAETAGDVVTLVASIRVGDDLLDVRRSGDSLLTAYASLTRSIPEVMLAAAFRAVLAPRPRSRVHPRGRRQPAR